MTEVRPSKTLLLEPQTGSVETRTSTGRASQSQLGECGRSQSSTPRPVLGLTLALLMTVGLGSYGCSSPGERAIVRLEQGLEELLAMVERHDRGDLDEAGLTAELRRWHEGAGRELEFLSREAARSSGPDLRAELDARWQVLAQTLEHRLKVTDRSSEELGE